MMLDAPANFIRPANISMSTGKMDADTDKALAATDVPIENNITPLSLPVRATSQRTDWHQVGWTHDGRNLGWIAEDHDQALREIDQVVDISYEYSDQLDGEAAEHAEQVSFHLVQLHQLVTARHSSGGKQ